MDLLRVEEQGLFLVYPLPELLLPSGGPQEGVTLAECTSRGFFRARWKDVVGSVALTQQVLFP